MWRAGSSRSCLLCLLNWLVISRQDSSSCASPSLKFSLCTPTPTPCKLLLGGAWPLELLPCLPRWYRSLFYPVLISLTFLASQAGSLFSESFGVILNCVWFSVIFSLLLEGSNQTFFFFFSQLCLQSWKQKLLNWPFRLILLKTRLVNVPNHYWSE